MNEHYCIINIVSLTFLSFGKMIKKYMPKMLCFFQFLRVFPLFDRSKSEVFKVRLVGLLWPID